MTISSVCIYCGSGPGSDPAYVDAATELGAALGQAGVGLVYGGGSTGLMGAAADAALAAGGTVTGIIPQFLVDREKGHTGLTELIVTRDMHERKWEMFNRADAFIALPGGIGTLEELIEVMTWAQLGRHSKPIIIVNTNGFWNHLLALLEHMSTADFLHSQHQLRPTFVSDIPEILSIISNS